MKKLDSIAQESLDQSAPAARACALMLVRRLEELELRLAMNLGNSSLPPSSERQGQQIVVKAKPKSERKRVGQPEHVKRTRSLNPTETNDRVVHHRPGACSTKLRGDAPNPKRHQIKVPPLVKPIVTEHQINTLQSPDYGHSCQEQHPATVPRGRFSSGDVAVVALLESSRGLSQRMISGITQNLYQTKVAARQINRQQSVSRSALTLGYNDILADVRDSTALNIDEAGYRQNGNKACLWSVVDKLATLSTVRPSRSSNEVNHLQGHDFNGIVVCDR